MDHTLDLVKSEIKAVYKENQKRGWDGYDGEPIKKENMKAALVFAEAIFEKSKLLIETVDIMPENTGAIAFEWFVDHGCQISISIFNKKLIYAYDFSKMKERKSCGQLDFKEKDEMIFITKQIIEYLNRRKDDDKIK